MKQLAGGGGWGCPRARSLKLRGGQGEHYYNENSGRGQKNRSADGAFSFLS